MGRKLSVQKGGHMHDKSFNQRTQMRKAQTMDTQGEFEELLESFNGIQGDMQSREDLLENISNNLEWAMNFFD